MAALFVLLFSQGTKVRKGALIHSPNVCGHFVTKGASAQLYAPNFLARNWENLKLSFRLPAGAFY